MKVRYVFCALLLALAMTPLRLLPLRAQEMEESHGGPEATKPPTAIEEAALLLADIKGERERSMDFARRASEASGEEKLVLEEQAWQRALDAHTNLRALTVNLAKLDATEDETKALRGQTLALIKKLEPGYERTARQWAEVRLAPLRKKRDEAQSANEILAIARLISEEQNRLQRVYRSILELSDMAEALGKPFDRSDEKQLIMDRADTIAERLPIAKRNRDALEEQVAEAPDDKELATRLEAARERLDRAIDTLSSTIAMMNRLDLEVTKYQQLLIQTSGEVTADILDREVALALFTDWRENTRETLAERGPLWLWQAFVAALILLTFRVASKVVRRMVSRALASSRVTASQLLRDTMLGWSARAVMFVGVLLTLSYLGVEIGPLLTGLGIVGFVVGFALQDTLGNFAAGAMILLYRPFDVDDVVEAAGISGIVQRMSLVSTTIATFDNQTLIVPNNKIWGDVIRNVTARKTRRVDMTFGIGYDANIPRAEEVLREIVTAHPKVLDDPAPNIRVHNLGDSSVDIVVRPWAQTLDYWEVFWDITREVKMRFEREGISIPFPQRDVHFHSGDNSASDTT